MMENNNMSLENSTRKMLLESDFWSDFLTPSEEKDELGMTALAAHNLSLNLFRGKSPQSRQSALSPKNPNMNQYSDKMKPSNTIQPAKGNYMKSPDTEKRTQDLGENRQMTRLQIIFETVLKNLQQKS